MSNRLKTVGLIIFNIVMACALLEGVFLVFLHVPRATAMAPRPVRRLVQQIYRHFNRTLIQFDEACAVYDPEVTYTLKPGTCTFGNLEFENTFNVNRVGVRDDEASLNGPEIIVLGDSHAMGWGVEQGETLSHVLARKCGLKVLNAAVSSYGTAREMMLLNRLDTSRLRYLIIQYADNDLPENRAFLEHGGRLPITPRADYQRIVEYYAAQRGYYPGKYLFRLLMKVLKLEKPEPDQLRMDPVVPNEEAELFLFVLTHASRAQLDGVQIIVFEVNQDIQPRRPFLAALNAAKDGDGHPPFVRRLVTLDTATVLTPRDFYVLDDHMKASGHQAIGEALSSLVRSNTVER
jgi:hypothetical protein